MNQHQKNKDQMKNLKIDETKSKVHHKISRCSLGGAGDDYPCPRPLSPIPFSVPAKFPTANRAEIFRFKFRRDGDLHGKNSPFNFLNFF